MTSEEGSAVDGWATCFWQVAAYDAMTAIGHRIDRNRDDQPYFWTDLQASPPKLAHQSWDYCDMSGRWVDALIRGRLMTGSDEFMDTEKRLKKFLISRVGIDGFFYNDEVEDFGSTYGADMFCQSRVLLALNSWFIESKSLVVKEYLRELVNSLIQKAYRDGKYAWFPGSVWNGTDWLDADDAVSQLDPKVAPALKAPGYRSALIGGLVEASILIELKEGLELASGLAYHYIEKTNAVRVGGSFMGHTHSGGVLPTTLGILRTGLAVNDSFLQNWAKLVFDYTVSQMSSFGWLPDGIGYEATYFWGKFCETCALSDLIEIGVLLSQNGLGNYWDVIERCSRNQLLENQIGNLDGLFPGDVEDEVRFSSVGSFACAALPNSYLGWSAGLEGCCLGSGIRAAYIYWRHSVYELHNELQINCPISKETESASVRSLDPLEGILEIVMKKSGDISLLRRRYLNEAKFWLNGERISLIVSGANLRLMDLEEGDVFRIEYSLAERVENCEITGKHYTIHWRGSTVTNIFPRAEKCQTYVNRNLEAKKTSNRTLSFGSESPNRQLLW
jgi:hypothetical protein